MQGMSSIFQSSTVRVVLCFLVIWGLLGVHTAEAGRRTIKFENKTGQAVDDLKIESDQNTTIEWGGTTPFNSERGVNNSRRHHLYNATVANGGTATVVLTSTVNTVTLKKWWWTKGGNAKKDGKCVGGAGKDDGSGTLTVGDSQATGNGIIKVLVEGILRLFETKPGSSQKETLEQFNDFLDQIVSETDEFDPIHNVLEDGRLVFASNILGDPELGLTLEVARPDSTQRLEIQPLPTSAPLFSFAIEGNCPGTMQGTIFDATPGGAVAIYRSKDVGGSVGELCPDTKLELAEPELEFFLVTDDTGNTQFEFDTSRADCESVFLQALDLENCEAGDTTGY